MRLFIAIPFSEKFNAEMMLLQKKLPKAKARNNKHFHITLQFFGDASLDQLNEIKGRLETIKFKPFKVKLNELGVFKNKKGYIKIAWAGFDFPEELKKLQKDIEGEMRDIGFKPDKPFKCHTTLARVKFADDEKFEQDLKKIQINSLEEKVDKFVLYESRLTPEGPLYEELLTVSAES